MKGSDLELGCIMFAAEIINHIGTIRLTVFICCN